MTDIIDCAYSPCIHEMCIEGINSYHCDWGVFFGEINCEKFKTLIDDEVKMYIKQDVLKTLS